MKIVVALSLVFAVLFAVASSADYKQFKTSSSTFYGNQVDGWTRLHKPAAGEEITVTFAIKMKNIDKLEELVLDISNPDSPNFLNHLSLKELGEMTSNWDNVFAVMSWLSSQQIPVEKITVLPNGDWIKATLNVFQAEKLFNAEFHVWEHPETKVRVTRTELYVLPNEVASAVDFVSNLYTVPQHDSKLPPQPLPEDLVRSNEPGSIPSGYIGPATLWDYYGISKDGVSSGSKSTCSVFEAGQNYDSNDLRKFQAAYGVKDTPVANNIGPNTSWMCGFNPNSCGEALLDLEYMSAVAQGAEMTWWAVSATSRTPFVDWIVQVSQATNPPLVHSVSYGEPEKLIDSSTVERFNTEVMKLAARGISVMISSGDDGVAGAQARGKSSECGFSPSFPASAPYVTAVGATQGTENNDDEVACASQTGGLITTGGGFSTVFDRPSWQSSAVSHYLRYGPDMPPTSEFASSGRGYPDVSMAGHNYIVRDGGKELVVSGTSASSPVFAGVITLINDLRLQKGKKPLGFLNQILYKLASSNPSVYSDVTSGVNNCAAGQSSPTCCQYGFTAARGWDPLTGLGSINYEKFSAAMVNL